MSDLVLVIPAVGIALVIAFEVWRNRRKTPKPPYWQSADGTKRIMFSGAKKDGSELRCEVRKTYQPGNIKYWDNELRIHELNPEDSQKIADAWKAQFESPEEDPKQEVNN